MSNVTSQSELTTKEIVEQAIQDYHESILPYLNGQVPTIANKFDKANLYSENEQIVGRWIDGKPLYQKTLSFTGLPYNSVKTIGTINDIETMVSALGTFHTSDKSVQHVIPTSVQSENMWIIYVSPNVVLRSVSNWTSYAGGYITIQYTKTTDEAIAIGSDTDYSLEEKIIGTWIDGKKIYKRTWTGLNLSISPSSWTITEIDSTNMKQILSAQGIKSSAGLCIPLEANPTENNHTKVGILGHRADRDIDFITLQYTKTN